MCNYHLSFDLQGQVYFKISIEDSILGLNSSNMCRKFPEKEESVGFSGRLPSLVLAFHVASEANFLEDFAAGVHISSQSCDLELVLCLHHKFPSVKLLYNIHIKITPSL